MKNYCDAEIRGDHYQKRYMYMYNVKVRLNPPYYDWTWNLINRDHLVGYSSNTSRDVRAIFSLSLSLSLFLSLSLSLSLVFFLLRNDLSARAFAAISAYFREIPNASARGRASRESPTRMNPAREIARDDAGRADYGVYVSYYHRQCNVTSASSRVRDLRSGPKQPPRIMRRSASRDRCAKCCSWHTWRVRASVYELVPRRN